MQMFSWSLENFDGFFDGYFQIIFPLFIWHHILSCYLKIFDTLALRTSGDVLNTNISH